MSRILYLDLAKHHGVVLVMYDSHDNFVLQSLVAYKSVILYEDCNYKCFLSRAFGGRLWSWIFHGTFRGTGTNVDLSSTVSGP